MAEYIERKALIEKIVNTPTVPIKQCYEGNFVYADGTASRQNEIINYITEQPTADVVEVVRCKECKYFLHDTDYCKKHNAEYCSMPKKFQEEVLDLINCLQAENEEKEEHIMELQGINESIKSDKAFLGKEIEKYHKELLKSKVFKFIRNPNRIYNIMDFKDGEFLFFYDYPEKPSALSKGYLLFKGKDQIRLLHTSEIKELSYDEIKAEAVKEFAEKVKQKTLAMVFSPDVLSFEDYCECIDNLVKEMVGDDK